MSRKPLVWQTGDLVKLTGVFGDLADVPQKCVNRAAGKGANVVRRAVKAAAPVESGDLRRGIVRDGERSRKRGKKIYQVTFSRNMNDVFQKPIKNPGEAGGKNPKAYYPASMEYGFLTRSKGGGLSYVPGYHFMRIAAEASGRAAQAETISVLNAEIDKEWAKK